MIGDAVQISHRSGESKIYYQHTYFMGITAKEQVQVLTDVPAGTGCGDSIIAVVEKDPLKVWVDNSRPNMFVEMQPKEKASA
jgi:hypothetical protein